LTLSATGKFEGTGKRQRNKNGEEGRRKAKKKRRKVWGGERVLQGRPDSAASTAEEAAPRLHRGQSSDFLPLQGLMGPVNTLIAVIYNSTA